MLHAARDDARLAGLADALAFFAPEIEVLRFPAWDCLPYDRVSPNAEIASQRTATLSQLAAHKAPSTGRIVVATVNALVQRVPPREAFAGASFAAKAGETVHLDALTAFLARNGYGRADTVREPGEFALRGGIVDIFPPGAEEPVRLDLFGDELERVRAFDPVSQLTTRDVGAFALGPVGEVFLDEESIHRFRVGYRELFGAASDDPLYSGISEGRRQIGMEHWLPLFHARLETLFDYLPDAVVTLDHQADAARDARLEAVEDYFDARKTFLETRGAGLEGQPVYRPLPPRMLYLDAAEWDRTLRSRAIAILNPFALPHEAGRRIVDLGARRMEPFTARAGAASALEAVRDYFAREARPGRRRVVAAYSAGSRDRLGHLLAEHGVTGLSPVESWQAAEMLPDDAIALVVLGIEHGFAAPGLVVVGEQDILGERIARAPRRRRRAEEILADAADLGPGDLVVHVEHGIGRYEGLETISVTGAPHDCFRLTYDGGDRLFVPVENIEVLSRYGSAEAGAALDKLGGHAWQARKSRLKRRLRDMADALIKVAAERALHAAPVIAAPPGTYDEFCARFPYSETDDQLQAIDDTLGDLATGKPMDRLICGDVGFGKTEVALRAAFATVLAGGQVAVVVPTTLLARQHEETFARRFDAFGIRIGQLSRLVAAKDAAETKAGMSDGSVHIVIGTHALLSKDIKFRNLTLLIVDEEQHFGVKHKERLKALRADVHVLTLTATPIPRTLQLALSGVREMSVIATPPVDRLAVRTFVLPYDPVVVREAILRERFRGGQIFYVCPRIEDLDGIAANLRELVPEASVAMAHGRLGSKALEDVMNAFYAGEKDILLSTQIVEFGLDIPSVNTMIVHRADMFGLAQLYQLRGRIGRSKLRAYCYLTLPPKRALTETAERRLHVLQTLDTLGAGFTLASHDLDIRGAGNLLGEEQSGHIREVGIELYQHMLEEAVAMAKGAKAEAEDWTPQINLGIPVLIPETYVTDLGVRLGLYRRLAAVEDRAEIESFAAELIDRFGPVPGEVENLLQIVALKLLCRQAGVERLDTGPKGAVLGFRDNRFANLAGLVAFIQRDKGQATLRPDHRLVFRRDWRDDKNSSFRRRPHDGESRCDRARDGARRGAITPSPNRLERFLVHQFEDLVEYLGQLRARDGIAPVDDEAGHAGDAERARLLVGGDDGIRVGAGVQVFERRRARHAGLGGDVGQHPHFADVAPVEEIGTIERLDHGALAVPLVGEMDQPVRLQRVGRAFDAVEAEVDVLAGADLGDRREQAGGALAPAEPTRHVRRPVGTVRRHIRIDEVRAPGDLDVALRPTRERALEPALADEAPGTGGVGDDVDAHRSSEVAAEEAAHHQERFARHLRVVLGRALELRGRVGEGMDCVGEHHHLVIDLGLLHLVLEGVTRLLRHDRVVRAVQHQDLLRYLIGAGIGRGQVAVERDDRLDRAGAAGAGKVEQRRGAEAETHRAHLVRVDRAGFVAELDQQ